MAGLSAAGYAAEQGARVVLLEKSPGIGGSAALSGGFVWTANSPERLQLYAGGRPELGEVVLRNYRRGLAWMREREITIGNAVSVLHGRGYQVDLPAHFASCVNLVEQHEGHVVVGTTVERLMTDTDGRVIGARTNDADGQVEVLARHTILATVDSRIHRSCERSTSTRRLAIGCCCAPIRAATVPGCDLPLRSAPPPPTMPRLLWAPRQRIAALGAAGPLHHAHPVPQRIRAAAERTRRALLRRIAR